MSLPPAEPPQASVEQTSPPALSTMSFSVILAILLGIFVFLHPLWEPMAMEQMDENILWSYYPIPLLVLVGLARERKLNGISWALETLKLTLVKFAITFLFANTMWAYFTEAPSVQPSEAQPSLSSAAEHPFHARQPPEATALDPQDTGLLSGRVLDASGSPLAGSLIFITEGLEGTTWAAPEQSVHLALGASGFSPSFDIVQTFQTLSLSSSDEAMHTAQATGNDGKMLFNYPVLPGSGRVLMFDHQLGMVELSCRAHDTEQARVLVLAHPFFARTDASGTFRFEGVPAGPLSLTVELPSGELAMRELELAAGNLEPMDWQLP